MSARVETSGFVGRLLNARWVVGGPVGAGTFGVVHEGKEQVTGNAVAIKLLHPQFIHHGETIARFWNEAEALRRMNHPNVLFLLDVGMTDDGVPFLVTELLTGETMRDLLNREGALPPERAMRLLGPAAHALHHAHLVGIVHRDLKPENIFRVRRDGMGTTKILDFGVAKLLDTSPGKKLSQTGIMLGTMAYSPPEQMQGLADIDHRADQFGFAALMFEALTGRRPFPQEQPFQLFQVVMTGVRPRASELAPNLPRAVDGVLIRGLDADRLRRYRDVEEFYIELTQALTVPGYTSASTTFTGAQPARLLTDAPPPPSMNLPVAGVTAPSGGVGTTQVSVRTNDAPPAFTRPSARFRAVPAQSTPEELVATSPQRGDTLASVGVTLPSAQVPVREGHQTLMEGVMAPVSVASLPVASAPASARAFAASADVPSPPPPSASNVGPASGMRERATAPTEPVPSSANLMRTVLIVVVLIVLGVAAYVGSRFIG